MEEGTRTGQARAIGQELLDGFAKNDLLTYASAIAFQVLFAIVPFALFAVAMLGLFGAQDVWHNDLAPGLKDAVSPAVFSVIDDGVEKVFHTRGAFWATAGAIIAVWEVSGAVRALMGALDGVYCAEERRSFVRRFATSFALSVGVGLCFMLAGACLLGLPELLGLGGTSGLGGIIAFLLRWGAAALVLTLAVGLIVHYAPGTPQPVGWVSFGSGVVVLAWLLMTAGFALYVTSLADYGSIFGSLAVVILLLTYLYFSATVFLFGVQLDAIVRRRVEGTAHGGEPSREQVEREGQLSPVSSVESERSRARAASS